MRVPEANSFSPLRTSLAAFQAREWVSGDAARAFYAGTATEIGGVLAIEPEHPDWEFHYLMCAAAPPGGLVEPAAFAEISRRILAGRAFIKGNLDPVNTILRGDPETVREEARRRLEVGMPGGGYILSTACSVAPAAPPENLMVLAEVASEGKY